jgi:hypothetical protein
MPKVTVVETDELPVCPYCETELNTIHVNARQKSLVESQKVCFCPLCRKVLGISYTRSAV